MSLDAIPTTDPFDTFTKTLCVGNDNVTLTLHSLVGSLGIVAAPTKLSQQDAEELRADINRVQRSSHPPKPNLTKNQMSALRELKKDRDRIVLTADKGVAMVVMDRQDYINKAKHLLNQNTYKTITKDPTNTIKNKLINILKTIKTKSGLGTNIYKSMYPTGCVPPKFYGLPKIHKPDTPLRPIVSSCGSVTYGVAKELAKILKPLVGQSPHHIKQHPGLCWTGQTLQIGIWRMPQFLWCVCPVHLCPHRSCPPNH